MKNYVLPILTLIALLLLSGRAVTAQTQLELAIGSSSTTTTGSTTATQTATLLENTTGTSFTTATPTTTVAISLSNQQYVGSYGNITTGIVYGALASNSSANVGSIPVFQPMNSVGSPASTAFTSSPCGPAGTGIDVAANYGFRVFASTKPLRLASAATTGRYRYADITLTFNQPLTNPVLHIVGLGGNYDGGTLVATQYFTAELELLTTGVTLSELSGSAEFNVTADNKILNNAAQPDATCGSGAACGSVRVTGTGITSLTFRVYIRGVGGSVVAGIGPSVWDGTAAHAGDGFIVGVSLDKAPTPTATTLTNICPATTANLTTIQPSSSTALEWHTVATNPSAATKVNTPTAVGAGIYYLYAMNGTNCYSPASGPVTVTIQTVTATLSSATICNGTSTTLTATGGTSYRFSTGQTGTSTMLVVSPTTNGSNPYSVTVTSAQGCSAVATGTVTVNPSVTATLSSATICNGTSATLTGSGAGAGGNYVLNPGSLTSATGSFVLSPTTNGVNTYTLTATSQFGCVGTATGTVTVNPSVTATLSSATVCNGTSATLTASGAGAGGNYVLNPGSLTSATGSFVLSPTTNGVNTYTLTATSQFGCVGTAAGTVTVNPSVTATLSSATICNGTSATLIATGGSNYRFSTGQTGTSTMLVVSPTTNGSNPYSVTVTSAQGCSAVAIGTVTVNPLPQPTISGSTSVCAGQPISLTANPTTGLTYAWSGPGGASGTANPFVIVNSTTANSGAYRVVVTDVNGCTAAASTSVVVNLLPVATLTASATVVCVGQPVNLTAGGGNSYVFSANVAGVSGNTASFTAGVGTAQYSVTATSAQSCTAVASTTVTVNPTPQLTVNSVTLCAGTTGTLTVTGCTGGTLVWSTGDNTTSLLIAPSVTTVYSATCTFTTGCSATVSTTATVNVSPGYDLSPTATPATCTGLVANNNARINLTTLQNTERADSSPGSTYTGPAYGAASNKLVSGGAVSFTGLANPGSPQTYTIRLFTPLGTCFRDVTVVLNPADCQCPVPGCVQVVVQEVR